MHAFPTTLLLATQMTTLHFNQPESDITNFWARGSSVPFASVVYLLSKIPTADAIKFCAIFNIAIGIVYPWNAEFFTKLGGKPLHKFPTYFFGALSVAGLLAL